MGDLICPACNSALGGDKPLAAPIGGVYICPFCQRSLVIDNGALRAATGAETTQLSDSELKALRALRKTLRESA